MYGLFSDEGCVEDGFRDEASATASLLQDYTPDDGLIVKEICPDHEEQPRDGCEVCAEEDTEDDEDDEDDPED